MEARERATRPLRDRCAQIGMGLWMLIAVFAMGMNPVIGSAGPTERQPAGIIDDLVDAIKDLLGGGDDPDEDEPLPDPADGG